MGMTNEELLERLALAFKTAGEVGAYTPYGFGHHTFIRIAEYLEDPELARRDQLELWKEQLNLL
jgi:hypothetical protein